MPEHNAALEVTFWFLLMVGIALVIPLLIGGVLYWRERFKVWNAPQKPDTEPRVPKRSLALPHEALEEEERLENAMLLAAMQLDNAFADAGTACFAVGEPPDKRRDAIRHALKAIAADSGMVHVALQLPEGMRPDIVHELWNIVNARGTSPIDPRAAEVHRPLSELLKRTIAFLDAAEALELHRATNIRYR